MPAININVTAFDPENAGKPRIKVFAPAASIVTTPYSPSLSTGVSLSTNTFDISLAALTPAVYDPDAAKYIRAVETADSQNLEHGVKEAINTFVLGCKADGTWSAIKAACILAGARTLAGALVPLAGIAPTNNNFVSGDYSRTTGLVGDGSTKYLDSNRAGNADPQDSAHLSCWVSTIHNPQAATPVDSGGVYIGNGGLGSGATHFGRIGGLAPSGSTFARNRNSTSQQNIDPNPPPTGMYGMNRSAAGSYTMRTGGTNYALTQTSQAPAAENHFVFARNNGAGSAEIYATGRLAFYSIGESLDLALLDSRVTTLMSDITAAIP